MYHILKKRGNTWVKPRKYFVTPTGRFRIGLLKDIVVFLSNNYNKDLIHVADDIKKAIRPKVDIKLQTNLLKFEPKYYQCEAINAMFNQGRGVLWMGTGAGKTFSMALALENIHRHKKGNFKCIFVVPDLGLVTQAYNDFKEYGVTFKFSMYSGNDDLDERSNVIIANRQILVMRPEIGAELISKMDMIVVDEVHLVSNKDSAIFEMIDDNKKTNNIFGMTGTIPTDPNKKYSMFGMFGGVIYTKPASELREEGHVADVSCKIINLQYTESPDYVFDEADPAAMYRTELDFLANHKGRNKFIVDLVMKYKKNSLVLVDTIAHGEALLELLKQGNKKVYFINGDTPTDERDRIKSEMEAHDDVVVVAITTIFAQGISINNLHMVLFADICKAAERIIQTVGRTLRKNHNKTMSVIIDLVDSHLKYSGKFIYDRILVYQQEKITFTNSDFIIK